MSGTLPHSKVQYSHTISALQFPHGLWEDKIVTLDHGSMQDLVLSFILQPEVLPPMPLNSYPRQYKHPLPGQLQWITVNWSYTALIPCREVFQGPIFHRLDYRFHCLPIVTTRSSWYELRADVKQDWISLEQTLRKVVIGMMDISLVRMMMITLRGGSMSRTNWQLKSMSNSMQAHSPSSLH